MAEITHYVLNPRQHAGFLEMLAEYQSGSLSPRPQRLIQPPQHQLAKVRFFNNSGEAIPAWGVMRITGATVDAAGVWHATVAKPNTTLQRFYLVNMGDTCAISTSGVGTFLHHGGHVLYDTADGSPAIGQTWGPQASAWTLKKNRWGFNIIGGNTGSGATSRTVAVQHIVNHVLGKTNASHAKGASGTVNLHCGTLGSETSVSMSITAWNRYQTLSSGKWIEADWVNGGWSITSGECT